MAEFPPRPLQALSHSAAPGPRAHRSPRLIIIGVLCACLGGLGAAVAWHQATNARQVVIVTHAIEAGAVVTGADLGTTSVGAAPGVATVPADQLDALVGQVALVGIPAGSLIAPDSIGEPTLAQGQTHVGVRLDSSRVPSDLVAGSTVMVAAAPSPTGGEPPLARSFTVDATVVAAPVRQSDGSWVFDLEVPSESAVEVATLASSQSMVVVHKAGE